MRRPIAERTPVLARGTLLLAVLAALLLAAVPLASASPVAVAAGTPSTASTGVWAWGAYENVSGLDQFYGSYANALGLTSANLSQGIDDVAEVVGSQAVYESFSVVNATAPNATTRSIEIASVWEYNVTALAVVTGSLPKVGTYASGATAPLVNVTAEFYEHIVEVSVYIAYANYTWANGSLALLNENFEVAALVNETVIYYHWPGYTNNANGTTTVISTTYGYRYLSYVAEAFSATFSPAVTMVKAPVSVGENWTANTTATSQGWEVYSDAEAYSIGSSNTSSFNNGGSSFNTTSSLSFTFDVAGSEEIVFPNGTTATGYILDTTEGTSGSTTYVVWDGLAIVPAAEAPVVPTAAPPALARVMPDTTSAVPTTQAVVAGSGFPVATNSAVSESAGMSTAPLPSASTWSKIDAVGRPAAPSSDEAPSVTGPPTLSGSSGSSATGGSGTSSGGTGSSGGSAGSGSSTGGSGTSGGSGSSSPGGGGSTTPGGGSNSTGPVSLPKSVTPTGSRGPSTVSPWLIAVALAALAVGFLGVEASRRRRLP